jgi:hypothetical protein
MSQDDLFRSQLLPYLSDLQHRLIDHQGHWAVKGFVDVYRNIYSLSLDTKVLSKVMEWAIMPSLLRFARAEGYKIIPAQAQNHYPDVSFVSQVDPTRCYALDIKTTYRTGEDSQGQMRINGMTLGTFGGYFRRRNTSTGITFPYELYRKHYVLGLVYTRTDTEGGQLHSWESLDAISSSAQDIVFFLQEKYRIASDVPGSGNTKNIGSSKILHRLVEGNGVFAPLGLAVFDDYWIHYQTYEMARQNDLDAPPYRNLREYALYKGLGITLTAVPDSEAEEGLG